MDRERLTASISAAQAGDAEGYRAILEAYGPRLYGYFLRAVRSHHEAEDLLGELMLRLVRRLDDYDDQGRFEHWLFRVAANLVRDRIRRGKSRPTPTSLSIDDEDGQPLAGRLAAADRPVDADLLAGEDARALSAALDQLDETTRQMILLRHDGEMSFKEIAEVMDVPLGTALAKVHRGLRSLRSLMEPHHDPRTT
jgi:RNA polymerase sigma-70 factor (ECF subfamily)